MAEDTKMKQMVAQMGLQGTFLEDLFVTMSERNFTDIPKDVDPSCEEVIGEMSLLEKALSTLRDCYKNMEEKLVLKEEAKNTEDFLIIDKVRRRFGIANDLLWINIHDRFPALSGFHFGIRKEFQVVVIYNKALTKAMMALGIR